jgi:DHA3 family macrolide efflux protein-like MFS transporter
VVSGIGGVVVGMGRSLPLWAVGGFLYTVTWPLTNACNQAIWQSKVPPDLQGRVFATRGLIAMIGTPISQVIAGPMADLVLEPAFLHSTGVPAALVGSGPGAGMAMMVLISGVLATLVGVVGYSFRSVREVETLLPDHVLAKADDGDEKGADGHGDEDGDRGEGERGGP